jgi:hypothetical protein
MPAKSAFQTTHNHNIYPLCSINHGNAEVDNVPCHMGPADSADGLQYAGYNNVPCGMEARMVSCGPKNAPGVGILYLRPEI